MRWARRRRRGRAPGALSVIRLSGPRAPEALIFLTEPKAFERGHSARDPALPEPRRMVVRTVFDPTSGEEIDRGLVVWFEAPNTETGEMMAELHLHGGRAVVSGGAGGDRASWASAAWPSPASSRAAPSSTASSISPRAEAIADLVAAETEQQRELALQQMDGALHRLYEDWRTLGLRALAHLEAAIDFPDEDLPPGIADEVRAGIDAAAGRDRSPSRRPPRRAAARGHLDRHHRPAQRRQVLAAQSSGASRGGHRVGDRRARRATSSKSISISAAGRWCWPTPRVCAPSADAIEQEGVRRAQARAASADLRLLVLDAVRRLEGRHEGAQPGRRTLGSGASTSWW